MSLLQGAQLHETRALHKGKQQQGEMGDHWTGSWLHGINQLNVFNSKTTHKRHTASCDVTLL